MHELTRLAYRYVNERRCTGAIGDERARAIELHLRCFIESRGNRTIAQLGPKDMDRWLAKLERLDYASSTRAVRVSSVKGFASWCVRRGYVAKDWTLDTPKIRRQRLLTRDVTADHVRQILAVCKDARETLIVMLIFVAGLRCCEVSRLDVVDYDLVTGTLFVTGKGGHQRRGVVCGPLPEAIDAYLLDTGHSHGPLVRTADGARRLGHSRISKLGGELFKRAGLKIRPYDGRSFHGIRACAASDTYDACKDPRAVQEFLGHVNLATTDLYLRSIGFGKVQDAVRKRFEAA